MSEVIPVSSFILSIIFSLLIFFGGAAAIDCYIKRQLVKANFWLSASTFGLIALVILMFLVDSCSND